MYGLYDKEGILRYLNSEKDACIAYAELFDLSSNSYSLMNLLETNEDITKFNLDQNQGENSS